MAAAPPATVEVGQEQAQAPPQDLATAAPPSAPAPAAAPADVGQAASSGANVLAGVQQAHTDFCAWFYQLHGQLVDSQMANLDAHGVKRELVGYGLIGLTLALLCTGMAPLVANLVCIAYPVLATMAVVRGQSNEGQRFLVYWALFGVLSLLDYYRGEFSLYWIVKMTVCVFLYLPQTEGALVAYNVIIQPALALVDSALSKISGSA